MYEHRSNQFDRRNIILHPGEYHSTGEDVIITTVLGSCVSVALYDKVLRIGGMNHFMLPRVLEKKRFYEETAGKYGMLAMDLLITDMMKKGCRKERLFAKVFGGASVISDTLKYNNRIPESNIAFALAYLMEENIPIESADVGGTVARKILFFPMTARVLLKRLGKSVLLPVEKDEENYYQKIAKKKPEEGDVTLF